MKIGTSGNSRSSAKKPAKVWMKEKTERTQDGEPLQVVNVYMSQAKGARLLFLEK